MISMLIIILFVFVTGLCIGSFLNVVILRALSNESIVFPASKCPKCQSPLKWYHNIPVLSYICLKGRCAFCNDKISIQYPLVELFTGFVFLLMCFKFGFSVQTVFMWFFSAMFIVLAMTDIKEKVIFVPHALLLAAGGLLFNILNLNPLFNGTVSILGLPVYTSVVNSILGVAAGIIIMEFLARIGYIFAGTRAFGEGDTYIAAGMGALFGWHVLIFALVLSVVVQFVMIIPVFLYKLFKNKEFKTLLACFVFGLAVILFNFLPYALGLVFLLASGIYLSFLLLKDLRNGNHDGGMYVPFGPAMIIASFIMLLISM